MRNLIASSQEEPTFQLSFPGHETHHHHREGRSDGPYRPLPPSYPG